MFLLFPIFVHIYLSAHFSCSPRAYFGPGCNLSVLPSFIHAFHISCSFTSAHVSSFKSFIALFTKQKLQTIATENSRQLLQNFRQLPQATKSNVQWWCNMSQCVANYSMLARLHSHMHCAMKPTARVNACWCHSRLIRHCFATARLPDPSSEQNQRRKQSTDFWF